MIYCIFFPSSFSFSKTGFSSANTLLRPRDTTTISSAYSSSEFQDGTLETEASIPTLINQWHSVLEDIRNIDNHNETSTFPPCF